MPEIQNKCEFVIKPKDIDFCTRVDGDRVTISSINFDNAQAASMAWLINSGYSFLKIEITVSS